MTGRVTCRIMQEANSNSAPPIAASLPIFSNIASLDLYPLFRGEVARDVAVADQGETSWVLAESPRRLLPGMHGWTLLSCLGRTSQRLAPHRSPSLATIMCGTTREADFVSTTHRADSYRVGSL